MSRFDRRDMLKLMATAAGAAVAGAPIQIPEPGIMELLALAAVAAVVVAIRKGPK